LINRKFRVNIVVLNNQNHYTMATSKYPASKFLSKNQLKTYGLENATVEQSLDSGALNILYVVDEDGLPTETILKKRGKKWVVSNITS
jgi:hypothetical protein